MTILTRRSGWSSGMNKNHVGSNPSNHAFSSSFSPKSQPRIFGISRRYLALKRCFVVGKEFISQDLCARTYVMPQLCMAYMYNLGNYYSNFACIWNLLSDLGRPILIKINGEHLFFFLINVVIL
jgi:hypothetical protein